MGKKIVASLFAGVGMLALAGVGYSQSLPSTPKQGERGMESQKASAKHASGEVTSIDAKTGKLAVKTGEKELNLAVEGSSAKKSLESIKVGDKVNVSYRDQGAMLVADSISKAGMSRDGTESSSKIN